MFAHNNREFQRSCFFSFVCHFQDDVSNSAILRFAYLFQYYLIYLISNICQIYFAEEGQKGVIYQGGIGCLREVLSFLKRNVWPLS